MSNITVAADETAATTLVHDAESALHIPPASGSGSLGPFTATYSASASLSGGTVTLRAPNVIEVDNATVNYSLNLTFSLNLNDFLPSFCLPVICIFGWCTPTICLSWPTISVPVSYSDHATFTADFGVTVTSAPTAWIVTATILGLPSLQLSATAAAIIIALGSAIAAACLAIPLIGPFLAAGVEAITLAIGIAGVTGFLGPIVSLFISGQPILTQSIPNPFTFLPAGVPNVLPQDAPPVLIDITSLGAAVVVSDKNELVLTADILAV
jgi:hypothetical protein